MYVSVYRLLNSLFPLLYLAWIGLTTIREENEAIFIAWDVVPLGSFYFARNFALFRDFTFLLLVPGSRRNARREIQDTRGAP